MILGLNDTEAVDKTLILGYIFESIFGPTIVVAQVDSSQNPNRRHSMTKLAERVARSLEPWKVHLGKLTLACGIGMVLLGFPSQIYRNWKAGECGIDPVLITVSLILYAVRIPYQVSARAWYLLPADVLGLLLGIVLLYQFLIY